jgi:hypothetical protein
MQTWRGYDSCEYPDDEVHATFETTPLPEPAPAAATGGCSRHLEHWCQDYEYIHDANARVTGYSCYDNHFTACTTTTPRRREAGPTGSPRGRLPAPRHPS